MTPRFRFWRNWLLAAAAAQVPFGLALAILGLERVFPAYHRAMCRALWGDPAVPEAARLFHDWLFAVLGATLAGWGLLVAWIAHGPLARGERWAWRAVAASLLVWFVPDTAMSVYYDVRPNVWFNLAALAVLGTPLLGMRRDMR